MSLPVALYQYQWCHTCQSQSTFTKTKTK